MSDTEQPTSATKDAMPAADVEFLLTCIKNTTGGALSVDAAKVATALGYTNIRSVGNKLSTLKKKYGLAITTSSAKVENGAPTVPAIPKTPTPAKTAKGKVTKPKTPRKTPVKKPAAKAVEIEAESAEETAADEELEDAKESQDYEVKDEA